MAKNMKSAVLGADRSLKELAILGTICLGHASDNNENYVNDGQEG